MCEKVPKSDKMYQNIRKVPKCSKSTKKGQKVPKCSKSTKMFEIIDNQFNNKEMPGYFFNLLELGQEEGRLYVDTAHYSSKMSKLIADRINKILKK